MNPVTGLSVGRIAVGAAAIVKPDLVAAALGTTSSSPLITQWFGSREIALGAATLISRGASQKALVGIGMAVDTADAATALQAVQAEFLPKRVGLATVGVATGAVLVGLLGLLGIGLRSQKSVDAADV